MSAGRQTWAGQKAFTAIDCSCNNNPGNPIGSAIIDKTAKALECKLTKLATEKCQLDLANQVRLVKLELVDLGQGGMPCQACTASDANEGPVYKKPQSAKSHWKALKPPQYEGKMHQMYLEFVCACNQVYNTQPDAYGNDDFKVIHARKYLLNDSQDAWYQCQDN